MDRLVRLVDGHIGEFLAEEVFRFEGGSDYGMGGDIIVYGGPFHVAFFDQQRDLDVGCYVTNDPAAGPPGRGRWRSPGEFSPAAYDYAGFKGYDLGALTSEFRNAYSAIKSALSEMEPTR